MKKALRFTLILSILFNLSAPVCAQTTLYLTSKDDDILRFVDSATTIITGQVTLDAGSSVTINGVLDLDVHPCTGDLYVLLNISAQSGRSLAIVDTSGSVTIIGNTGDNFASMAFDDLGVLYTVTGDGANTPETLYTLDLSNASPTFFQTLGNGNDGEVIAYDKDDGYLYHWSGNGSNIFEKINLTNNTVTNIPFTNANIDMAEVFGATYGGSGQFLVSNIDDSLFVLTTSGYAVSTGIGLAYNVRGFAFGHPHPIDISVAEDTICSNDTAHLMASDGTAYQWYLDGQAISGATAQQYDATAGGWYNCVITTAVCSDSATFGIGIEVLNSPVVNISATANGICPGGTVLLNGSGGGSSQWYLNGQPINGATNPVYNATQAGLYNMVKTNTNGCSDSAAVGIHLTAFSNPDVDLGNDSSLCPGDSTVLDAGSFPGGLYIWQPFSTQQTKTVGDSGIYAVSVTNAQGCIGTDSIHIGIFAPLGVDLGNDTTVCENNPVALDAGAYPNASYSWNTSSGQQTIVAADSGDYEVTVTSEEGCTESDTIHIGFYPSANVDLGPDTTACSGDTVFLDAGAGFSSYDWFNGTTTQTTAVTEADLPIPGEPLWVGVTVYNSFGCRGTDSVEVTFTPCTGIAGINTEAVRVFPNPSRGRVNITAPAVINRLVLRNVLGEIVMVKNNTLNSIMLDIEQSGPYSLELWVGGQRLTKKLLIVD